MWLGIEFNVLFIVSDDCKQCPRVLSEIEHIDDEADGAGINFVKIDDKKMAKEFGIFALPAILFFRQNSKEPVIYAGKSKTGNIHLLKIFSVLCFIKVIYTRKTRFWLGL